MGGLNGNCFGCSCFLWWSSFFIIYLFLFIVILTQTINGHFNKYTHVSFFHCECVYKCYCKEQRKAETSRGHWACVKATWPGIYCAWVQVTEREKVICRDQEKWFFVCLFCSFLKHTTWKKTKDIRHENFNKYQWSQFSGYIRPQ